VRLARSADEVRRAQRLRFEIFNLELGEGLAESHVTGLDVDRFDEFCDHLIVEEVATGEIVGTYRLQTGQLAAANLGAVRTIPLRNDRAGSRLRARRASQLQFASSSLAWHRHLRA